MQQLLVQVLVAGLYTLLGGCMFFHKLSIVDSLKLKFLGCIKVVDFSFLLLICTSAYIYIYIYI